MTARLGGEKTIAGFRLVYDEGIADAELTPFEEDLQFHRHQLAPVFGEQADTPVHVYLYASFEQYDRLVARGVGAVTSSASARPLRRTRCRIAGRCTWWCR